VVTYIGPYHALVLRSAKGLNQGIVSRPHISGFKWAAPGRISGDGVSPNGGHWHVVGDILTEQKQAVRIRRNSWRRIRISSVVDRSEIQIATRTKDPITERKPTELTQRRMHCQPSRIHSSTSKHSRPYWITRRPVHLIYNARGTTCTHSVIGVSQGIKPVWHTVSTNDQSTRAVR